MNKSRKYTREEKEQIMEEAKASGNILKVSKKNNIPVSTIHTWFRRDNPKVKLAKQEEKQLKLLKKQNNELNLKNKILKELLKKTYLIWPEN